MWHHGWLCLALAEFMVILGYWLHDVIEHLCCFVGNIHLCGALSAVYPLYSSIFFGASRPKAGGSVGLVAGTISALYRATLQLLPLHAPRMTICFGTIHPNTLPCVLSQRFAHIPYPTFFPSSLCSSVFPMFIVFLFLIASVNYPTPVLIMFQVVVFM
jgi:hypothetical protein